MKHKTKEVNVRKEMVEIVIREDLSPEKSANHVYLPPACYTTSKEEKNKVLSMFT